MKSFPDLSRYAIEDSELQSLEINPKDASLLLELRCPPVHWKTRRTLSRLASVLGSVNYTQNDFRVSLTFLGVSGLAGSLIESNGQRPISALNRDGPQVLSAIEFGMPDKTGSTARFDFIDGTVEFSFCDFAMQESAWSAA
jgi:hypothetical protein